MIGNEFRFRLHIQDLIHKMTKDSGNHSILGDPGADKGGEGKSKREGKYGTKKSKERREEPLGTMSYQTSSNGRRRSGF